ncbi:MAG: FAD binding domain-containing protein [Anaerolineaceae bacterium]|nr:MAG: FAD binding domain-containing protein [Anaerolineaceae bacterium]
MCPFEYYRPKTVAEALKLLDHGVPLAGGTDLIPRRDEVQAVIDLQDLGLDTIESQDDIITMGAAVKLQAMVEDKDIVPSALREACCLEASLNLRNMATLGGTVMSADGRSPVVTVLLAMDAIAILEPGNKRLSLEELLDQREKDDLHGLITEIRLKQPDFLGYEQVSRAPADRPLVCVAMARLPSEEAEKRYRVVVGGVGSSPERIKEAENGLSEGEDINTAVDATRRIYTSASDEWASGEYRAHTAGVLVGRLATEMIS